MSEWLSKTAGRFEAAFITSDRWKLYVSGFLLTFRVALIAAVLGVIIGTILAFMKLHTRSDGKRSLLNIVADFYIDVIRGTPNVLQLLIMWFVIMANSKNGVLVACLSFGINSGAYVAEIIRAGILSVDKGQMEAGRSLGLSTAQTYRHIILPQAFKTALPPLGNEFIVLLKETAIVGYVSLSDLTRTANQIASRTYDAFMPLIGAAFIYLLTVKLLTLLFAQIEKRMRRADMR